ncbi:MAG: Gfo/Idh/MocA family oxidoreductase, partial [Planctomycetaceae bacterium]|nr:Gfo/Idh/MocA family oxidoreductase [Planctomycetaceae bacterium]
MCSRWNVAHAAESVPALLARCQPEILVIATPPSPRADLVATCPTALKAVLCEKPLGA